MSETLALSDGALGFDCNVPLDSSTAILFKVLDYSFAVRYIPRRIQGRSDVTRTEVDILRSAGLAVMLVQHVESEKSWVPSQEKAVDYAFTAVEHTRALGFPVGTCVWLDLEGVDVRVPAETIIKYCNQWYDIVVKSGSLPGIYVGWHCGLDATQLYERLKFKHYWGAYNLNRDQEPIVRGLQMHQRIPSHTVSKRFSFPFDENVVKRDRKGGLPIAFGPKE